MTLSDESLELLAQADALMNGPGTVMNREYEERLTTWRTNYVLALRTSAEQRSATNVGVSTPVTAALACGCTERDAAYTRHSKPDAMCGWVCMRCDTKHHLNPPRCVTCSHTVLKAMMMEDWK